MWEAIRSNRRRSYLLIGLMALILLALGASIGMAVAPPDGWLFGALGALALWLILWTVAASEGDAILLGSVSAREISKEDAPQLWNVVEEMTIAAGLGRMPRVYVIDDEVPNAFAVGRDPQKAAVAVTSGLLRRLDRDELQGVIGHELGHIRNLDVKFMTLAGVMVGAVVLLSEVFLRGLFYGAGRRRSRGGRGGGQAAALMLLIAIVVAILGPLVAQLLYFACSRRREYLADASSAQFTRYPEGLASALEKISRHAGAKTKSANRVVAPLYIVNPLQARGAFSLTSTHPPTEKRIAILRSMGGQAGLAAYEAAYRKVTGAKRGCIGAQTLSQAGDLPARPASPGAGREEAIVRSREALDLVDRLADFLFIACACGVRLKVPPEFRDPKLRCPRCGRVHELPTAELAALAAAATTAKKPPARAKPAAQPMRYRRTGTGWESFRCRCGQTIQLSPSFAAAAVRCPKCRQRIEIVFAAAQRS